MDDGKKKRRNKKKKNKQNKAPESFPGGGNDETDSSSSSVNQYDMTIGRQDYFRSQFPEEAYAYNNVLEQNMDMGQHSHHPRNATQECFIAEAEKQQWLQRQATLEETIKQLQNENSTHIQKEAMLEETIRELQNEINSFKQKRASLDTKLVELQTLKDSWIENEAGLKKIISQLLEGKASHSLKVASLEDNIKALESEKRSWILKENSAKETISSLNDDITKLKAQVAWLGESRKSLSQGKQVENISGMHSQVQNLEKSIASSQSSNEATEHEDPNSQMEGARALVAKLILENTELAEKVNELQAELNQRDAKVGHSSATGTDVLKVEAAETVDPISGSNEHVSGTKPESSEAIHIKDGKSGYNDNADGQHARAVRNISEADASGETEHTSLNDNETVDLALQEAAKTSEEVASAPLSDVSLSDAPLTGAPLRLISMVARYVSGADLADKNTSNSSP